MLRILQDVEADRARRTASNSIISSMVPFHKELDTAVGIVVRVDVGAG
jgi:hypothetical protein